MISAWTMQMVGGAWTLQRLRKTLLRRTSAMRWLLLNQMKEATRTQSRSLLQAQLRIRLWRTGKRRPLLEQ